MKKVLLVVSIVSLFVFSTFIPKSQAYEFDRRCEDINDLNELEMLSMQQAAIIDAFEKLCMKLDIDQSEGKFPEGYGGAYIDSNNQLAIKVLDGYDFLENEIIEVLQNIPYRIEKTDISCLQLDVIAKKIADESQFNVSPISQICVSHKEGIVKIGISEELITAETQNYIEKLRNTEHVLVYDCKSKTCVSMIGGTNLKHYVSGNLVSIGSLGFCGSYLSKNAVITAGHVANGAGGLYYGSNYIGPSLVTNYFDGAEGDYAVIKINNTSTTTPTNKVYIGSGSTGAITSYSTATSSLEGTTVLKYGYVSGLTSGTITGYNIYVNYDNNTTRIYKLMEVYSVSTFCSPGDSGGPVYRVLSSGARQALGTVSGRNENNTHIGYYSPLSNVSAFIPKTTS